MHCRVALESPRLAREQRSYKLVVAIVVEVVVVVVVVVVGMMKGNHWKGDLQLGLMKEALSITTAETLRRAAGRGVFLNGHEVQLTC
jgi:Na+(H+)/acetate symporter ActP